MDGANEERLLVAPSTNSSRSGFIPRHFQCQPSITPGFPLPQTVPTLLSKLEELTPLLRLERGRLVALMAAYPALLGASPAAVHRRFTLLVVELRRDEQFVSDMVAGQPVLLGMAEATLRQRVGLLHEAASLLPKTWWVQCLASGFGVGWGVDDSAAIEVKAIVKSAYNNESRMNSDLR